MKKWQPEYKPVPPPVPPPAPEKHYLETMCEIEEKSPIASMPWLECIGCKARAVILFEGTSFCRVCLKFEITTGQTRRHYE